MTEPPSEPPRQPGFTPGEGYMPPPPQGPGGPGFFPPQPPPPKKRHILRNIIRPRRGHRPDPHRQRGHQQGRHHEQPRRLGRLEHQRRPGEPGRRSTRTVPHPSLQPPDKVEFIVSGYAPGDGYGTGPSVNYGSGSDTHQASPASIERDSHLLGAV